MARLLATLREAAAWRERTAQRIDIPRQRLLRDEQLLEIASHAPVNAVITAASAVSTPGRLVQNPFPAGSVIARTSWTYI